MSVLTAFRRKIGAFIGGFEGEMASRRLKGLHASRAHVNALIQSAGPTMASRARYMVRNNGYAANAVESWAGNAVGTGIRPSSKIQDEKLKDAAECIAENVRLSVVLDTIHAHATRQHQNHDDEHRGNDLVPFFIEYGGNDVERVVFRIEPEQMENPRHAQHTENDEARQKKDRDDRQQIHHSIKGNEKAEPGASRCFFWIEIVGSPDAQRVFNTENQDTGMFQHGKQTTEGC